MSILVDCTRRGVIVVRLRGSSVPVGKAELDSK